MKQIRRLIYRTSSKDFLLSENRSDCSVVTIAKPKDFKLNVKEDVFLSANDRNFVEQEIIQKRNLAFYEIIGNKELVENKDEEAAKNLKLVIQRRKQEIQKGTLQVDTADALSSTISS
jgi:hypothetical protein